MMGFRRRPQSIFKRQFFAFLFLVLIIFMVFSIIIPAIVYNFTMIDRRNSLENNANRMARFVSLATQEPLQNQIYVMLLDNLAKSLDAEALICDTAGTIVLSVGPSDTDLRGYVISERYTRPVLTAGRFSEVITLTGIYDHPTYTVGLPITSRDGSVIGIMFLSSSLTSMGTLFFRTGRIFILFMFLILLIALVLSYFLARSLINPLNNMLTSVNRFESGDFTARAPRSGDIEMIQLSDAFNSMAVSMQKLEDLRRDFVANISHELRSPMTVIAGFIEGILDGTIPREKQNEYLIIIKEEIGRLTRLINSMLDISRFGEDNTQPLSFSTFDICELVRSILIRFEGKINEKHLTVQTAFSSNSINVRANSDGMTQVINNLLDNAIKFSPEGGTVSLDIKKTHDQVWIGVKNTGADIPADSLPFIFDRFHKADKSRGENKHGLGLGLYIVKSIVAKHGKKISVTSQQGVTEFVFSIDAD